MYKWIRLIHVNTIYNICYSERYCMYNQIKPHVYSQIHHLFLFQNFLNIDKVLLRINNFIISLFLVALFIYILYPYTRKTIYIYS